MWRGCFSLHLGSHPADSQKTTSANHIRAFSFNQSKPLVQSRSRSSLRMTLNCKSIKAVSDFFLPESPEAWHLANSEQPRSCVWPENTSVVSFQTRPTIPLLGTALLSCLPVRLAFDIYLGTCLHSEANFHHLGLRTARKQLFPSWEVCKQFLP